MALNWSLGELDTTNENSLEQRELKHDRNPGAKPNPGAINGSDAVVRPASSRTVSNTAPTCTHLLYNTVQTSENTGSVGGTAREGSANNEFLSTVVE
jgi:hypothetical protein